MTKSFHSQICFNIYYQQNFYLNKNWTYLTIFNEKFPNHCKEEINSTVSSNILPLYKASSWIWQLSLCENNFESQIYLLVYKLNVYFIRLENLVYWNNLFIIYIVMLYMFFLFGLISSALFNGLWISIPFSIQARPILELQVLLFKYWSGSVKYCFNYVSII